jgi:hypothetical protein
MERLTGKNLEIDGENAYASEEHVGPFEERKNGNTRRREINLIKDIGFISWVLIRGNNS